MSPESTYAKEKAEFLKQAAAAYDRMMLHDQEQMNTFVQMESRVMEVGSELERALFENRLARAARAQSDSFACPRCSKVVPVLKSEERRVKSRAGEVVYSRGHGYCRSCRKAFFPYGRLLGTGD
jgi:uncharacterized protein with PIN domain